MIQNSLLKGELEILKRLSTKCPAMEEMDYRAALDVWKERKVYHLLGRK